LEDEIVKLGVEFDSCMKKIDQQCRAAPLWQTINIFQQ
jgi:hypothetical protein